MFGAALRFVDRRRRRVTKTHATAPATWRVVAAFAAVYTIWGSTFLAIRFAVETIPPFLMAGGRFVLAGAILYIWMRASGNPAPTRAHWRSAVIIGGLLLVSSNGVLAWSEQTVPSGFSALMIATVPVWMVLFEWLKGSGVRPNAGVAAGLVLGLIGIALLIGPAELTSSDRVNPIGVIALFFAALSWAAGSFYGHHANLPASSLLGTGMEMLAGGVMLLIVGTLTGEWGQLALNQVSMRSLTAVGYLFVFGSLVGFSAYTWLLRVTPPALSSTYAFVNPVVAVFLGWALAGEMLTAQTLLAAAVIVVAVVTVTIYQSKMSIPKPANVTSPVPGE
jgi:drug/metabolite transporter (DMT)-like permease